MNGRLQERGDTWGMKFKPGLQVRGVRVEQGSIRWSRSAHAQVRILENQNVQTRRKQVIWFTGSQ